jgi:hypothetical protein
VAASLRALAGVLESQGDLAGARERLQRVLEIEANVYGPLDHYFDGNDRDEPGQSPVALGAPLTAREFIPGRGSIAACGMTC